MTTYLKGGQRRTIEVGCGWRCVGHPQEVNKKYILHKRYCKDCIDNNKVDELAEFNKVGGKMNGWKGITNRNQQPNQMLTTTYVNGLRQDIIMSGANTIDKAMDNSRLFMELVNEQPTLSKGQKKRQKAKAKASKVENIGEVGSLNYLLGIPLTTAIITDDL
jgi:hypothetical protein